MNVRSNGTSFQGAKSSDKRAMTRILVAAILVFVLGTSCSPVLSPFTQRLYDQNRWTETELRQIQFYVSDDIVLRRVLTGSKSEIVAGEIKMINGSAVEEVVIRAGTPGVAVFVPEEGRLGVAFEADSDNRYLMFGPNPKLSGRFVLLASEWERNSGIVTYGDKKYRVASADAMATLMVDLKRISQTKVQSRTAGGRRVN